MNPKISIIIPVYNVEEYLRECLDSVVNQTMREIEFICVDDGSTDSSSAILDEYASRDNRFVVVHQENRGVSVARNAAMKKVSGDYILFLDSDDFLELNACSELYSKAIQTNADMIQFLYRIIGQNSNFNLVEQIEFSEKIHNTEKIQLLHLLPCIWLYLFRASFLIQNEILSHEKLIFEDVPFAYTSRFLANKIVVFPHTFYNYRIGTGYSTSVKKEMSYLKFPTAYNQTLLDLEKSGADNVCKNIFFLRKLKEVYFAWAVKKRIRRAFAKEISRRLLPEEITLIKNKETPIGKKVRFFYLSLLGNPLHRFFYSILFCIITWWDWFVERLYYRSSLYGENEEKLRWLEHVIQDHIDYYNNQIELLKSDNSNSKHE